MSICESKASEYNGQSARRLHHWLIQLKVTWLGGGVNWCCVADKKCVISRHPLPPLSLTFHPFSLWCVKIGYRGGVLQNRLVLSGSHLSRSQLIIAQEPCRLLLRTEATAMSCYTATPAIIFWGDPDCGNNGLPGEWRQHLHGRDKWKRISGRRWGSRQEVAIEFHYQGKDTFTVVLCWLAAQKTRYVLRLGRIWHFDKPLLLKRSSSL